MSKLQCAQENSAVRTIRKSNHTVSQIRIQETVAKSKQAIDNHKYSRKYSHCIIAPDHKEMLKQKV
jgi:hypothetical protein